MVVPLVFRALWALGGMAGLLSLRLLPFAVYGVLVSANVARRVFVATAYLILPVVACSLGGRDTIELVATGSVYYLVASLGVYWFAKLMATGRISRAAAFVFFFLAFLLLPGALFPGDAMLAFLVVGWELWLSSYSYCVETSRPGARQPTLGECLFFLLVNPMLVYTASGVRLSERIGRGGLWRAGAGAALMFVNSALFQPLASVLRDLPMTWLVAGPAFGWLLYGVARFFTFYFMHIGLASIHIGLMRQAGWVIPERYRFPVAAASPIDFWRRWNTYVRMWLEAYVFLPTALRLTRKIKRTGPAVAAVVTLLASGLMHDAYGFAGRQTFGGFKKTQMFLGACAFLALWRGATILGNSIRAHLAAWQQNWFDLAVRVSAHASMVVGIAQAARVWG